MDLEGDATYHQIESRRIWFSVVVGERGYYRAAGISTTSTSWHETCRHSSEVIPVMQVSPHPRGVSENQVKKLIAVPKLCAPKTTLGLSTSIRIHFTTNPGQCRLPPVGIFRKSYVPKRQGGICRGGEAGDFPRHWFSSSTLLFWNVPSQPGKLNSPLLVYSRMTDSWYYGLPSIIMS